MAAVVRRLAASDMDSGFGLRTMSSRSAGFNPLSYHGGSVWEPRHRDRAARAGRGPAPRMPAWSRPAWPAACWRPRRRSTSGCPELYGGESAAGGGLPLAYPAACRPQAWSAEAALVVLTATLGLTPDVPAGRVTLRPMRPSPAGELTVAGLRVAGQPLDVRLTAAGDPEVLVAPPGLTVDVD